MTIKTYELTVRVDLNPEEERELGRLLGAAGEGQLQDGLVALATTALGEYVAMFCGVEPLTTAGDLRERRLMRLVRGVFGGRMPSIPIVAAIFGRTPTAAGNFVRSTAARHRSEMGTIMAEALKTVLDTERDEQADGSRYVIIPDAFLVSALNDLLRESGSSRTAVRAVPDSLTKYKVDKDSFVYLRGRVG